MVYSISDKVDKFQDVAQEIMDAKFQRVKTREGEDVPEFPPSEKWRIWKNVLIIGFAFMVHFTAFWGASNLQSSINADDALGTFTLAAIYGSLILSNIFLPVIVIRWLGCKWTIALSFVTYMPFMLAQFYPRFYTMIPAGLAVGFGGGPLWCAKCTYLTVISEAYYQVTGVAADIAVTRFFGVFFMFYQFSQVWGNLISSAVLSSGKSSSSELTASLVTSANSTSSTETSILNVTTTLMEMMHTEGPHASALVASLKDATTDPGDKCGANFCPMESGSHSNPNLAPPSTEKINLIAGIYLGCMIAAALIVAFGVDSMTRYNKGRKGSGSGMSGLKLLAVTLRQLSDPYQIMILPITMFIGAEQAFLAADFNAAFVSCGWGISKIGFVMICFGICNALAALLTGSIVKMTGRPPVICFALVLHVSLMITMMVWKPNPDNSLLFFLLAGLWGVADAVWLVQINSLSGILFEGKEEASYSNFRLWESTGSVITYAYNPYLCTNIKLYLLLCLLLIGVSGYTTVEYLEYRKSTMKNQYPKRKFRMNGSKENGKTGEVAE